MDFLSVFQTNRNNVTEDTPSEDDLETVDLVEAEEIVTANCNIHEQDELETSCVTPEVETSGVMPLFSAKENWDKKFSTAFRSFTPQVFTAKAAMFKKAFSLPKGRLPRTADKW